MISKPIAYLSPTFGYNITTIFGILWQCHENPETRFQIFLCTYQSNILQPLEFPQIPSWVRRFVRIRVSYYINVSSTLVIVVLSPTLPAFLWSGRSVWCCQPWPWRQALISLQPSAAFSLSSQQSPSYPKRTKYNMHKFYISFLHVYSNIPISEKSVQFHLRVLLRHVLFWELSKLN